MINSPDIWIPCPLPRPQAQLRLFCIPYAGAGASLFYSWLRHLPDTIEICPLQLPGRENRLHEPAFTEFSSMLPIVADGLRPYLDLPFAFFGHSMGALIAFELARFIRQRWALAPVHVCVSGICAPQLKRNQHPVWKIPDDDLSHQLLSRYSGFSAAVLAEPELLRMYLPILRADLALLESYEYIQDVPLDSPLTVFGGWQDKLVSYYDLTPWNEQTVGPFALQMFSGDHFYLHAEKASMLQAIVARMAAAMAIPL